MFPNASRNALPGARGSRHSLDQRTLHKLVQRKTGPLKTIVACVNSHLHNWQEELGHKAENTICIIGRESRSIRISSRNDERSNKTTRKMEDSTDISGLVLYQTLFYLLEKISVTIQKFKI